MTWREDAEVVRAGLKELAAAILRDGESAQTAMPRIREQEAALARLTERIEELEAALRRDGLDVIENVLNGTYAKPKLAALDRLALARDRISAAVNG